MATHDLWIQSKRSKKLTNFVVSFQGMPKRKLGVELIAVAPSVALTREVAIRDEFGDDALGGAFGDPHFYCDIAQSHAGVLRNAEQNVCVISKKGPGGHRLIIDDTRSAIHASVSTFCSACIDGVGHHGVAPLLRTSSRVNQRAIM